MADVSTADGGSLLNSLKLKLIAEQKELQQLRIDLDKSKDELKGESEKRELVCFAFSYCNARTMIPWL
jgi:hypothetical protein